MRMNTTLTSSTSRHLQKKGTDGDAQFAVFSRYAKINFVPDVFGDLVFNDVASNVTRESLLNGTQVDASYIVNDRHTLAGGLRGERRANQRQQHFDRPARSIP